MSDYSDVPQCGDFLDESLWLNNIYSELASIPNTEVKKTECKKIEPKIKKNNAKKTDIKNKTSEKPSPNHDNWLVILSRYLLTKPLINQLSVVLDVKT